MAVFEQTYQVYSADMGPDYLLKTNPISSYFQETFAIFTKGKGIAAYDLGRQGLSWVISENRMEFGRKRPFWNESFTVRIWLPDASKLRIPVNYLIASGQEEIARGECIWLVVDSATRRPVVVTDFVAKVRMSGEHVFSAPAARIFPRFTDKVGEKEHKITFENLDFNYHLNNLCYSALALEAIPEDYRQNHLIHTLHIKFLKECFAGDTLRCEVFRSGDSFFHLISRQEDSVEVCLMESTWLDK